MMDAGSIRRVVRAIAQGQGGQTVIEYAIVLALIVLAVSAAGFLFGKWSEREFSFVAARMTGETGRDLNPMVSRANANAPAAEEMPEAAVRLPQYLNQAAAWVLLAAGAGMAVMAGATWLRRRRRSKPLQPIPHCATESLRLESRFFVKRQHLLRQLSNDPGLLLHNKLEAQHLMTAEMVVVQPGTSCQHMRELMQEANIRHLLVCNSARQLLGVVSNRDLAAPTGRTAAAVMRSDVRSVAPDTQISPAITYMVNEGISCLPVVDGDRLCGILTTTDLILAMQCMLQLWLHTAQMAHSETWEQQFMEMVQTQAEAAEEGTCRGLKGFLDTYLTREEDCPEGIGA